jgi:REP element-mobilizing transposase RayT
LIKETQAHDLIYKWMDIAYQKGYRFFGYVIMPNHVHFIIRVPEAGAINTLLANGKRFIAYGIIDRLVKVNDSARLTSLQQGLRASDVARGQKHRVFEPSTDLIELFSGKMIEQKLRYMHANPVSKRWSLADDAEEYEHSSFAFYVRGERRAAPLTAYHEFGYLVR